MTDLIKTLTIKRPDDWHLHLRDDEALQYVTPHTAQRFTRAIVMPNLVPPITTAEQAIAYKERILNAAQPICDFEPLMTLYATDNMTPEDIERAHASGVVKAVKVYPAGATTNSDSGVTDIKKLSDVIATMEALDMPLLLHGEVTDPHIDTFDREAVYIETILKPLCERHPKLRIVLEHITTKQAADFIRNSPDNIAATLTPQHMLLNRNALFAGGLQPHHYCLPILKRSTHQEALCDLAASGHSRLFLGTDSAPHAQNKKENSCGCAGIYSSFAGIELYAQAFDDIGALDKLEAFASLNGPRFYGLSVNDDSITLSKTSWQVPDSFPYIDNNRLIPFFAQHVLQWKITEGLKS